MMYLPTLLALCSLATAHMDLMYPPPLKSKFNPFAKAAGNIDSDMTSPLPASGGNNPCKGYQSLLGTPEGASVATFSPGGKYNLTIEGGAFHEGGSCQASLSYDKAKTFTVIQSWVGECPTSSGGTWDFTVPDDAPEGMDVLLQWTWYNRVGNREQYTNCASVTIGGGGGARKRAAEGDEGIITKRAGTKFSDRPAPFVANIGNGCGTVPGMDVIFPDPGPDVVTAGSKLAAPTGTCQAPAAGGGGSGSGSGGSGSGSGSSPSAAPTATTGSGTGSGSGSGSGSAPSSSAAPTPTSAAAPTVTNIDSGSGSSSGPSSASLPGGVFVTAPGDSGSGSGSDPAPSGSASSASAPAPTTFATATTRPAATGGSGSGTTPVPAPAGTGGTGSGTGTGTGSAGTQSGACTDEGAWNCIAGGASFQRCASGAWSAPMAMAAGTSCKPGLSDTLWRRSSRVRRGGGW
ncbi:hypothetical protein GE09DRAFT_29208 [Coniochaeta sp. 2T2.1]|nr:hypothetical protein GE09DRAFT_29208 [Coniochaeta sp. 2T2.1]